jgi:SAM-dependent methyltransferase
MAEIYDEWLGPTGDPQLIEQTVTRMVELAGDGRALELGIGTGRIALPLTQRGVEVHGIDASEAMVEKLRAKPGGANLPVTIGDFRDVPIEGRYSLVFVVFNTFFSLLSQEEQLICFENVATHLADDGVFLIEAFVPDLARYERNQRTATTVLKTDSVRLESSQHDPLTQRVDTTFMVLEEGRVRLFPLKIRYAYPSELDLMARLAGLRLKERWGGWNREPFTSSSPQHISLYSPA